MTTNSYTGTINTNGAYETIATVTGYTFTSGKTYAMQVQGGANFKIGDAEFLLRDEKFYYTATEDSIYIKTEYSVILTILEL